jgi:hypothetical protein
MTPLLLVELASDLSLVLLPSEVLTMVPINDCSFEDLRLINESISFEVFHLEYLIWFCLELINEYWLDAGGKVHR